MTEERGGGATREERQHQKMQMKMQPTLTSMMGGVAHCVVATREGPLRAGRACSRLAGAVGCGEERRLKKEKEQGGGGGKTETGGGNEVEHIG